jgi:hypothetical protein
MDGVSVLDLPTGEYAFRLHGGTSNLGTVAKLVRGSEVSLYDVVGPGGRQVLEVAAVPGATPLADNETGTVLRAPGGDPILTLEDRNWTYSYALYDAADGSVVATMRKSWYAVGPVAVSGPDGDRLATVETEGLLPNLGSRPRARAVTTPDGTRVARLDHAELEDAPDSKPRRRWTPTVALESSALVPEVVLAVALGVSESARRSSSGTASAGDGGE